MKKLLLIFAALLLATGSMFARGAQEDTTEEPAAAAESAIELDGVEIIFWHQHTRSREEAMASIVEEFNASNPYGITVTAEYAGGYSDIYNKMINGLAGGVIPDLVVGYQNQAGAYMLADGLVDMETYVNDPEYGLTAAEKADFIEGIYNSDYNAQFDNKRLGFPPNRSMEALYYNMDWLRELGYDAPPTSWAEFEEMCIAATDAEAGTYGYALATGASNLFALAISHGGDGFLNAAGTEYDFNQPAIVEALETMKNLYDAGAAVKIAEAYGEQGDFANRKTLFTIGSTSGMPYYGSAVDGSELGSFEWSVTAIPHNTDTPVMDLYGASVSIPKTTPEKQLAAWVFIKYLTAPEPQRIWVEASGYFPVRQSVRDELGSYLAENTQYRDAFDILLSAEVKTEPPFASYEEVRSEISAAFNSIIDGADIESTLAELTVEANLINEDMMP